MKKKNRIVMKKIFEKQRKEREIMQTNYLPNKKNYAEVKSQYPCQNK